MSDSSLNADPRLIPLVRSLKEKSIKSNKNLNNKLEDLSSEKTSDNSPILENADIMIKDKNEDFNDKKLKSSGKNTFSLSKKRTSKNNVKHYTRIKNNTKISIDAVAEPKVKAGTSQNNNRKQNNNIKISIVSKTKEPSNITLNNNIFNKNNKYEQKRINNIKTRSKYVQNLMNDINIRKYKQSCVDLLKNDNTIKKLYEKCGFEKTNYNYENFIQNHFFNQSLFIFKLEMLFLDESNFGKKNFKENFFKKEIIKYLSNFIDEEIYKEQITKLNDIFKEEFENILNFDLFHD